MEEIQRFPMTEILKKFPIKADRFNFCRKNSIFVYLLLDYYLQNNPGFGTKFFIQFLSGQKKIGLFLIIFYNFYL